MIGYWRDWRPMYEIEHVNALAGMLREYIKTPHQIVLLTDQNVEGLSKEVDKVLPLPNRPEGLVWGKKVDCFRRLRYFDPEYASQFGTEYVMSIDLDTLIRSDITDIVEGAMRHPLTILKSRWGDSKKGGRQYNGAFYIIKVGANSQVWTDFDPVETPKEIIRKRWVGSDQSTISMLAPGAKTIGVEDGAYFFGQYLQARRRKQHVPARIINFAGRDKPWLKSVRFQAKDIHQEYMQWMPKSSATSLSA